MGVNRRLRYHNLVERGIVNNRTTLRNRIENDGFPPGEMTGPNERSWDEEKVEAYLASRPQAGPTPRGIAKTNKAAHKAASPENA
jgi:hypothetical protein